MEPIYDAAAPSGASFSAARASRPSPYHDLPDLYRPRRRLHPTLMAGLMFCAAGAAFYGAEMQMPPEWKPSHFTGGYQREIAKARTDGELASRIVYDAKLKRYETAAAIWQEQCKAGLQTYTGHYQAAYARANAFANSTAELQRQYAAVRYGIVQSSVGGEIGAANAATSLGYILGFFDQGLGQAAMDFADKARQQAYRKLDEAAQSGIVVSVDGWDVGLPSPGELAPPVKCDLPVTFDQPSGEG